MKTILRYWEMMKKTSGNRLLCSFLVFYFVDCFLIYCFDSDIHSYGDALWMGFSVATTIGLGDYTVTHGLARFLTVLLGIYGTIMEAYIPGLIASYYLSRLSEKRDQIVARHAKELGSLSSMSDEQKQQLSRQIRKENAR
ncbi:potassium channel family protein [Allobaculum mucilyticum]|uniref:potassium channel family protein n=1 Tax=Allobaculum mucilyticum TaxID=2834459 RepID=UPI001E335E99|nr:potassium channel family protein [Allobaculum mucilyticum]UNT96880.1 potassium channel family protein [Allobaculum mucilyticum]